MYDIIRHQNRRRNRTQNADSTFGIRRSFGICRSEFFIRSSSFGIPNDEFRTTNFERRISNTEFRTTKTERRIPNDEFRTTDYRINRIELDKKLKLFHFGFSAFFLAAKRCTKLKLWQRADLELPNIPFCVDWGSAQPKKPEKSIFRKKLNNNSRNRFPIFAGHRW